MIYTAAMLKHGLQRCISIMIPHCFKLLKGTSGNVLERPRKSFILRLCLVGGVKKWEDGKLWEDGKVRGCKIFSFPSYVFGWRGGKVG